MTSQITIFDKIIKAGLLLLALVLPISIAATDTVWIFLLLVWLARTIVVGNSFVKTDIDRPIFWLLAVTIASSIMAIDPMHSIYALKQIALVLFFWLLVSNIKEESQLKKMVYFFLGSSLLVSIYAIAQYVLGINRVDTAIVYNPWPALQNWPYSVLKHIALDHGRAIGTRSHPLTFAECVMMTLTLIFCLAVFNKDKKKRIWLWLATLIMLISLMFSNSRGPLLGAILGIFSLVIFRPSKKAIALVAAILVVIPLLVLGISGITQGKRITIQERIAKAINWRQDNDSKERVFMWQSGWQMIKENPVLGIGLGNIHEIYEQYKSPEATHKGTENELHSNLVQITVERGLLGIAAFIWLAVAFFIYGYKTVRLIPADNTFAKAVVLGGMTSVVAFLGAGLTETTYNDGIVITMLYFMMALVMWVRHKGLAETGGYANMAVFMDRDGTMSEEVGYINHVDRFHLLKRTAKAVRLLNQNKLRAIVVTNQAGVGRGYFKEEMVGIVHKRMEENLAAESAFLDAIYYCPHHPKDNCDCRKPKPGMMLQAKEKFGLDLTKSYVIGDKYSDVEYAHQVGAKGILVLTGYGKGAYEFEKDQWSKGPDFVAGDLYDAVEWIIQQEKK